MISLERRNLAMTCGNQGRFANAKNLISECRRFMLSADEAAAIINAMSERVRSDWRKFAKISGVSDRDCEQVKSAFVYPGFFTED
jgi:serine/threonine-protein kinase HipA